MRRKKKARRGWRKWRKKKRKPALASSIPGFVAAAVGTRTTSIWPAGPAARRRSRDQVVSFTFTLALAPESSRRVRVRCRAMQQQERPPTVRAVTIPFADLRETDKDLGGKIEEGLGPHGLGIITIADVPEFPELRKRLLRLAPRIANLPEQVKKQLEDPDSRYNFGWSHGKEKLESGKLDTFKGSFYANPVLDVPTTDDVLVSRYPSYCRPNIWPNENLPELEIAFKALGKLMMEVGLMLAHHCDRYVMGQGLGSYDGDSLEQTIAHSRCHKGRLLYYFPRQFSKQTDVESVSSWCGWHTDHGSLTGLTCGLFTKNSVEVPCPDSAAGLYIRTRGNQVVKVVFDEDQLAYQIGETTEILSRGYLCATPHCVQAPSSENASNVDRSTFALFMQPDWNEKLKFPSEIPYHQELIPPNGTLTFGEYSERLVNKYYQTTT